MSLICEYCGGKFNRASNLRKHQNTAKFCRDMQTQITTEKELLTCQFCKKSLSRADSLYRHYATCIEYQISIRVTVLTREIEHLHDKLAEKDAQLKAREAQIIALTETAINKPTTINVTLSPTDKPVTYTETSISRTEQKIQELIETISELVRPLLTHDNIPMLR